MKERPILFSAPMVGAILGGRKTQTRRVYSGNYADIHSGPYGQPGDRLWVRERWRTEELESGLDGVRYAADNHFRPIENTFDAAEAWGDAHFNKHGKRYNPLTWRPSIFMPRWASRITLEIVNVRVEKLHEIKVGDVIAEGVSDKVLMPDDIEAGSPMFHQLAQRQIFDKFVFLWDSINAERGYSFSSNPWVWVISFRLVEGEHEKVRQVVRN